MSTEESMQRMRREYEEAWKKQFAKRLNLLVSSRGIEEELLKDTLECDGARVKALLDGKDFPTTQELLRLCFLCYDADEILFGARERGFSFLLRGKF